MLEIVPVGFTLLSGSQFSPGFIVLRVRARRYRNAVLQDSPLDPPPFQLKLRPTLFPAAKSFLLEAPFATFLRLLLPTCRLFQKALVAYAFIPL